MMTVALQTASHVTCHTSHITHHTSHATRHTSHVTCQDPDPSAMAPAFATEPEPPEDRRTTALTIVTIF